MARGLLFPRAMASNTNTIWGRHRRRKRWRQLEMAAVIVVLSAAVAFKIATWVEAPKTENARAINE